jgi:hypothetical protein
MRSNGLTADDWQVVTEYIDVLGPLKECTKRLEGRGAQGNFGAIAEIILTFKYLLNELESRLQTYDDVEHDVHEDAPKDHLAINLRAALIKAREYYNKFDLSPAYYAATILHPRYKTYCDTAWAANPEWLELNNGNFEALWAQYRSLLKARATTTRRPKCTNIDDAINSVLDPGSTVHEEDEFDLWKRREPQVEAGSEYAKNPILYWVELRDHYPNLSKLVIDVLSIPASSCECERVFSELGDLLEPRRRGISPELLAGIHCSRRWRKAGFGSSDEVDEMRGLINEQLDAVYDMDSWAIRQAEEKLNTKTQHQK